MIAVSIRGFIGWLVGFTIGVFGPLLFSDSNQGPLLGIFFTGPIGLLLGLIWGALRAIIGNTSEEDGLFPETTPKQALRYGIFVVALVVAFGVYLLVSSRIDVPIAPTGETTKEVIQFTAVYDSVGMWNTALGGRLISIDPDTEYLRKAMFRKSVYFLSYPNSTKFIGLDRPNLPEGAHVVKLPTSQQVSIQGYYHTGYHRPTAQTVQLVAE